MEDSKIQKHTIITACTGSGYAEPGRGGSAYLVEYDNTAILLDCGEGAAGWVNKYNLSHKIAAVFISHLHPDHIAGLFMLVQNMYINGRQLALEIYLPGEGIEPVRNMLAAMYLGPDRKQEIFTLHYFPLSPDLLWQDADFTVRAWLSDHFHHDNLTANPQIRPAFGFTIDAGSKRLIYTADVASVQCFAHYVLPGSILICEAAHIDFRVVVRLAFDKQVERLVFTHIDPAIYNELYEYCRTCHFVTIAGDGLSLGWKMF